MLCRLLSVRPRAACPGFLKLYFMQISLSSLGNLWYSVKRKYLIGRRKPTLETISGVNNWKLVIRREDDHIVIIRAVTCDKIAALPDTLFGLPVTELARRALAPTARDESGEEVLVTCGPVSEDAVWDNRKLIDLTLPRYLERVRDYALMSCDALEILRLHDTVRYWNGGALMNCRSLNSFFITRVAPEQSQALAYFASELTRELDVTITEMDGSTTRLIFPEYQESYEENFIAQAVQFEYHIYGAGFPYHNCFKQKQLRMKVYDDLWKAYMGMEYDPDAAIRLAWYRLRYPTDLLEWAREQYWKFLRENLGATLHWLVQQKDPAGIRFLFEGAVPTREELASACQQARELETAEVLALLLETQHRLYPVGMEKSFDL